jgi:hypothetical protein
MAVPHDLILEITSELVISHSRSVSESAGQKRVLHPKFTMARAPSSAREARALPKLGNELLVRNGRFLPALSCDSQIFEVFQQFFVFGGCNNDGCTFAAIVGDVLNRIAHEKRLEESDVIRNRDPRTIKVRLRGTSKPTREARALPRLFHRSSLTTCHLMVAMRLFRFALLFLLLLLSGCFGVIPSRLRMFPTRLRVMRNRLRMARPLMWLVARTSVSGCFARVRFGLVSLKIRLVAVICGPDLVPVCFSVSCALAFMFRYVPGLVSRSCSSPKSLCALAMLLAFVE